MRLHTLTLTLIIFAHLLAQSNGCENFTSEKICQTETGPSYRLFGTKTTYENAYDELVRRNNFDQGKLEQLIRQIEKTHKAQRMFFFSRHSIKFPEASVVERMKIIQKNLLPQIQSNLAVTRLSAPICSQNLDQVANWVLLFQTSQSYLIMDSGVNATKKLAQQWRNLFPQLLSNSSDIELAVTYKKRSPQTMTAFLSGLGFGDLSGNYSIDEHLYFHEICKGLLDRNGVSLSEPAVLNEYRKSELIGLISNNVAKRLGLEARHMTEENLFTMYKTCGYETAIYGTSAWCKVFSTKELTLMEYYFNVEAFLEDGGGRQMNHRMACPLLKKITNFLDPTIQNATKHTYLAFSHAGALKPLLTILQLNSELKSFDWNLQPAFCDRYKDSWNVSLDVPFNSHFAFILYQDNNKKGPEAFKVLTLLNQQPIHFKDCDELLCSWNKFKNFFDLLSQDCDLSKICNV